MKNRTITACALLCAAAIAGAPAADFVGMDGLSTTTILPTEAFDAAKAAQEMNDLNQLLVANRAPAKAMVLDGLTKQESSFLAGEDNLDTRRFLVGVDRTVTIAVDLDDADGMFGAVRTAKDAMIWTSEIRSPGASALRAHLTEFNLPKGAELFVYGQYGDAFGPYTASGTLFNGEMWTNTVAGDTITLQLEIAGPVTRAQRLSSYFVIDSIGHMGDAFELAKWQGPAAAKDFCTDPEGPINADCVFSASCGSVGPAGDAQSAIAAMLYKSGGGYYICSGGLLSNGSNNPPAYFLTANHCVSKGGEASSLETYWDHTASCNTTSCSYAWAGGRAAPGASILSTNRTSDYTLLQLAAVPSGRAYLGWNNSPIANSHGADLHRISHPAGSPQAYSKHSVDTTKGDCQSWPRGNWIYSRDTYGATEGGSSGSPVLNGAGQVVGQLSGGCGTNVSDSCDSDNNATVDGAIAAYWGSVSQWLDGGGGCSPSTEVCDGVDNNCDGQVDEGGVCDTGGSCTELGQLGDSCSSASECCSNKCKGRRGNQSCR